MIHSKNIIKILVRRNKLKKRGYKINSLRSSLVGYLVLPDCKEKEAIMTNKPKEQYASIDAVTVAAGGGMNGPKHPSDIRGEHPSMYPAHQHGVR